MEDPPAIRLNQLTKDFPLPEKGRYLRAVDHVSLNIPRRCVFGLLGPNGSGKSTTIKMLLGLSSPSSGSVEVLNGTPDIRDIRSKIGYLPDAPYYHGFLSGRELLKFFGKLLGMEKRLVEQRSEELLAQFGLSDASHRKLGSYSKGMLQRLGFAQALLNDPELLILDEPTAGVDPVGAMEVGEFILRMKGEGKTVLLCSHLLSQVEDVCDRVGILNKGRLLKEGKVSDLLAEIGAADVTVSGLDPEGEAEVRALVERRGANISRSGTLEELFRHSLEEDAKREAQP